MRKIGLFLFFTTVLFLTAAVTVMGQGRKPVKPAKSKVTPDLQLIAKPDIDATASVDGLTQENVAIIIDGKVLIDAYASDGNGKALLSKLQALGLSNGSAYERVVSGFIPIANISQLESVAGLQFVQPSYTPQKSVGLVTSQADIAMKADIAKANYGVTGAGSKIGVMSDSYNALGGAAAGVASGDLPPDVEVLADLTSGSDEGRGMAELIHDVAPGAKLAFHTAFTGQAGFANGIRALADNGCNIIVDDVFYFAEPFFQDGIIAQAVDEVVKNKVTYFSSAGNHANSSYEAPFKNSGIVMPGAWGEAHDFGNGDLRQSFVIQPRGILRVALQWDDPFFSVSGGAGAKTDMDLLIYFNGSLAFVSAADNIGGDPFEFIGLTWSGNTPVTVEIAIVKYAGPDPRYLKWVHYGNGIPPVSVEYDTKSATCVGHSNAKGAIAVGAVAFYNTPAYNPSLSTAVINSFSSRGGTPVFIKKDGKSTGVDDGKRRAKPEIVAVDGTNTTFFGSDISQDPDTYPNFFGTSAAAPHAAAVAALMQEVKHQRMSPASVLSIMQQSALDMDDPQTPGFDIGFDYRTGAGLIQADACVAIAGGNLVSATEARNSVANLDLNGRKDLAVYPNPSRGMLTISLAQQATEGSLVVYNTAGAMVYRRTISAGTAPTFQLNLTNQAAGMYFIKLSNGELSRTVQFMLDK